ncbi:type IV toxin-antitoxin system AbiEi family antitoxin domain-containing protein, partial [Candidatus Micrarchaeota archaeon]|nr:type IV toxin-antitoxin system AbiEi family antitoxin domain-containing protein [Candidatus Micrarchaeota archaeon]
MGETLKGTFLGPLEYALLAKLERSGKKYFSFVEVMNAGLGASRPVLRNTLSKLVSKGRLHRIRKGEYLLVPLKEEDYALHE